LRSQYTEQKAFFEQDTEELKKAKAEIAKLQNCITELKSKELGDSLGETDSYTSRMTSLSKNYAELSKGI
jgi:hypothetical protein